MKSATIEEAQERLAELIAAARAGQEVEITDGGEAVATLTPTQRETPLERFKRTHPDPAAEEARIARLTERGILRPGLGGPKPTFPPLQEPIQSSGVLDALIEERRTGR